MKINLKFIAALLCFYFAATTTIAQNTPISNAPFIGVWELAKMASNGLPLQNTRPGYLKIFNADGSFINIQVQNTGSIIKQSGHYNIDDDQSYREAPKAADLAGRGFKISYEFSPDKKMLTIGYSYKDGTAFTEAYRKVQPAE